jgi:hypothetical protein
VAKPYFAKMEPVEKIAQECGLLLPLGYICNWATFAIGLLLQLGYFCNWATFSIFKKLHKVNNYPMDENSPNPVTLSIR